MTNAVRTSATKRVPMDSMRKTALAAGVLYVLTFLSIPRLDGPNLVTLAMNGWADAEPHGG